ncbi:hypothetical protein CBM2633_P190004 [Cupriavidus taiwanensis]
MDEFALHKGHRFATVVVDPSGSKCSGSVRAARARRRAFFEQLPPDAARRIEAVALEARTEGCINSDPI